MNRDSDAQAPRHHPGARKGDEVRQDEGREPGRHDSESTGAKRPSGGKTARDSTAINPESTEAIDPRSPRMPPA
jgi:hypothetical protein